MHVGVVWLTAALLSFPLLTLCDPLNVLVAPNLLRVGTPERVFVEAQDYSGNDLNVKITVKNHPDKATELTSASVVLTAANNYQAVVEIKIPDSKKFSDDPLEKQYVYLQAQFPSALLEKVALLSFQSGYIFIQTDKSIYRPGTQVRYRIFSLTSDLLAAEQAEEIYVDIINPEGITLSRKIYITRKGTMTELYRIPEVAKPGMWSLVTSYRNKPETNFTAEFEVKDYVLPSFEVVLQPSKSFFYVDDQELQVDITAKGLNGKNVDGVAFVVFGIMKDGSKTPLSASLKREQIVSGEGRARLTREMIQQSFPNIADLVGSSIYISVSVLTESGSEMVEAERRGIKIVKSPYIIQFKRTPKFFKPGMPFDIMVHVTNPDQSPAENVVVMVTPGDEWGQTKKNGMAKVKVNTQGGARTLRITAKTAAPGILPERQAVNQMTVQAYNTNGGSTNYLHISVDVMEVAIGDQMTINVVFKSSVQNQDFTYLILSKGQIVKGGRFKRQGQSLVSLSLPVTKDLVPSFRVVAYYHIGSSEVVSDSIWVDVKDTCMGTLKLEIKERSNTLLWPVDKFHLIVTGDPKARVGLVAVDKAAFVLNKNRLTQTKIRDVIEKLDIGCTAGSGKDSMGVFYDAGLLFQSDKAGGTTERTAPGCSTPPQRKKRGYHDDNDDGEYINPDDIVSRTLFHESRLWMDIDLPPCPGNIPCELTSHTLNQEYLRDSITTWQVLAISLSKTHGICVADPYEITVAKDFFVDLKLPYSAVRNEQLEIKAILHNFSNRQQKVRVEFFETEHVCSVASKKKKYRTIVNIDPKSTRTLPYVIIPMELGNHVIEVQAASATLHDGVRKTLKVVSEGVLTELLELNLQLNPSKQPGGIQVVHYRSGGLNEQVPNSYADTYVTVAVAEFYKEVSDLNLDVEVSVSNRSIQTKWNFNKNNARLTRTEKFLPRGHFTISAKGSGAAVLKVFTLYYARPTEKTTCTKYDLSVKMIKESKISYPDAEESCTVIIDLLFKDPNRDATMTILDIGLLTGFVVDETDLSRLTSGKDRYIQKFEMNKPLSGRGSLIIYLDKVSRTLPDRIVFKVHKIFKVAFLQPAALTVYEYNSPEARCVKFYHPTKKDGALDRLCRTEEGLCQCAEENCSVQKKHKIDDKDRENKACEEDMDYAYKVKVLSLDFRPNIDIYEMRIDEALREGSDPDVQNKLRTFMGHPNCRESFGFELGKDYLIMGQSVDLTRKDGKLQYILGEGTWIEYWPTRMESHTSQFRDKYIGIASLRETLTMFGCSI